MSQDHTKLSSEMISKSIMELVNRDTSIKVKVIIAHVAEKYKYIISYKKAWIAKCKAIKSLYGNWETSYNDLPQWILVIKTYLPGTIIELQSLPVISNDGSHLGDQRIFHRLFWAFRPCIRGFAYCKPIMQDDGTWLYDKYRGTLLMVVAQDGNFGNKEKEFHFGKEGFHVKTEKRQRSGERAKRKSKRTKVGEEKSLKLKDCRINSVIFRTYSFLRNRNRRSGSPPTAENTENSAFCFVLAQEQLSVLR
ncbi:hypothetical protein KIW84_011435 [Lathyrus oleraceus]|uniref:Uncharacterized protein n=1 Tax=Pisum sativum TaxID=3888 RepID=A0A9D5BEX6_PEA|nr:hypothetical protein KIW84_011435 [Pisum sativum]